MYLGHFWHAVLQPEGEHRASHRWTTVLYQYEHTGCGAGAAAWRGSIAPRDPFTLCRSDFTLSHLSDLFLPCICRHTCIWKSPSHSYFHPETCFYKNCKFFHLTQLINQLFIICTDERLGWRMGGNVFAMTMSMRFVYHLSLIPHLLCALQ